jgi:hypothetical protein
MTANGAEMMIREARAARRLLRLFRIERGGGFERRPAAIGWRLIERRGDLLAELSRLERQRRALAVPPLPELEAAIGDLAREAAWSRSRAELLAGVLAGEIEARRRPVEASGLRDGGGRLLGHG